MLVHWCFTGKVLTNKNKFKFLRTKELNCLRFEHLLDFLPFFAFFLWFSPLKLPNLFAIAFLNPLRSSIVDKVLTFSLKKSVTQSTAPKFSHRLNHNALKCPYNIFIWTPLYFGILFRKTLKRWKCLVYFFSHRLLTFWA